MILLAALARLADLSVGDKQDQAFDESWAIRSTRSHDGSASSEG